MDQFTYHDGRLYAEGVALDAIAGTSGTPCFVYSRAAIEARWRAFDRSLAGREHLVCYAVKANPNLAVLNILARLGSGFDIVSLGELQRVLAAGGDPARIVFSGVGKGVEEIRVALQTGIRCLNVESVAELRRIDEIAGQMGIKAPVSLRINPDVDAQTHPYIATGLSENKFGIPVADALALCDGLLAGSNIDMLGLDCHIGSQLTDQAPFVEAVERVLQLASTMEQRGITIRHLDMGGGLGIRYQDETPPAIHQYGKALLDALGDSPYELLIEPGRAILGNSGVLLTRVEYLKSNGERNFAVVDAAMTELLRPALYQAWHDIVALQPRETRRHKSWDIVGPVCETADCLGHDRRLDLEQGDVLAILSAGAYGSSMCSTYNSRPRVEEIMVDGESVHVIRRRETIDELFAAEQLLPE